MTLTFTSGGAVVGVEARTRHFREAVRAAAGGPDELGSHGQPDVILVEGTTRERSAAGAPVSRGVTRESDGAVVFDSAGGSGYRQRWQMSDHVLRVESTWDPSAKESAAARVLPARHSRKPRPKPAITASHCLSNRPGPGRFRFTSSLAELPAPLR